MKIPYGLTRMRNVLLVAVTLGAALLIAACGGSSTATTTASTTTTASGSASRVAYTACLKSHGVTTPTGGFGGGKGGFKGGKPIGTPPSGGTRTPPTGGTAPSGSGAPPTGGFGAGGNSKYTKAAKACASKLPKGEKAFAGAPSGKNFGGAGGAPKISDAVLTKFVACIRKHGDAAMPEPNKNAKNGVYFPLSAEKSAAFKKAEPSCQSVITKAQTATAGNSTTSSS